MGDQYNQPGSRRENQNYQQYPNNNYYAGGPRPNNMMPPPVPQSSSSHMIPPAPRDHGESELEGTLADINDPFWLRRRYTRNDSFPELKEMDMGHNQWGQTNQSPHPPQQRVHHQHHTHQPQHQQYQQHNQYHQQQQYQQAYAPRTNERSGPRQANKPGAHTHNYTNNPGYGNTVGGAVPTNNQYPHGNRGQPVQPVPSHQNPGRNTGRNNAVPGAGLHHQRSRSNSRNAPPKRGTARHQPNTPYGTQQQPPLPPVPNFNKQAISPTTSYGRNQAKPTFSQQQKQQHSQPQYGRQPPNEKRNQFIATDRHKGFKPPKFNPTFDNSGGNPHFRPPTDSIGYQGSQGRGASPSFATHGSQFATPRTQYENNAGPPSQLNGMTGQDKQNSRIKRGRQGQGDQALDVLMSKNFAKNRNTPRDADNTGSGPPPVPPKSRSRNHRGHYTDY